MDWLGYGIYTNYRKWLKKILDVSSTTVVYGKEQMDSGQFADAQGEKK